VSNIIGKVFRATGPFIRRIAGYAMVLGAIAFLAGVTIFTMLALTNFPASYLDVSFAAFLNDIHPRILALVTSVALLIPGVFVLAGGIGLLGRRGVLQPFTSLVLLAVWFFAAVLSGALWIRPSMRWAAIERSYPAYQTDEIVIEPAVLASIDASELRSPYVRIVDGERHEVRVEGRSKEIGRITYSLVGSRLEFNVRSDETSCVICDRDRVRITIASPTPDSIQTTPNPERDYAAEEARRDARADSIRAERLLREAAQEAREDSIVAVREARQDSIRAERMLREAYPRQLEELFEQPDSARPQRLRALADSLEALQ
jgi:hypothetical protein